MPSTHDCSPAKSQYEDRPGEGVQVRSAQAEGDEIITLMEEIVKL